MDISQSSATFLMEGLNRLRQGDHKARADLLAYAEARFRTLASRMLKQFPGVKRWEETGDILQTSLVKLHFALLTSFPKDRQHFLRLSTLQIRRTLVDLARHYRAVIQPIPNHDHSDATSETSLPQFTEPNLRSNEPLSLEEWTAFHEAVASLPIQEREVFELVWYQGLTQQDAATLLKVNERTVRRHWTSARLLLSNSLQKQ